MNGSSCSMMVSSWRCEEWDTQTILNCAIIIVSYLFLRRLSLARPATAATGATAAIALVPEATVEGKPLRPHARLHLRSIRFHSVQQTHDYYALLFLFFYPTMHQHGLPRLPFPYAFPERQERRKEKNGYQRWGQPGHGSLAGSLLYLRSSYVAGIYPTLLSLLLPYKFMSL